MNNMRNTEIIPMKEQLINFLISLEYKFGVMEDTEERTVIQSGLSLEIGDADGYFVIHHKISLVEVLAYFPLNIPENKRLEVSKFMDIMDYHRYLGNLQLNHERGQVRSKTYFLYTNELVPSHIINTNYFEAFRNLENNIPSIMSIVYAGKDAETAANEYFGKVNPKNN